MDRIKVQVNGRGYFLKTDHPEEVLSFADGFSEQIEYVSRKLGITNEAEATAYSALLLMGDSLGGKRSESDQALIDELNGKVDVLEERIDSLTSQVNSHSESEAQARTENAELKAKEQELTSRIAAMTEREEQLTGTISENRSALDDTKSALASANKIIAQLNTEKFTEVAANEALRSEVESSRERLEAANKQIAELNGKITKMEINSIAVEADGTVSVNEETVKKLRAEKEDLEIELAIANEEIDKLKAAGKAAADENEMARKLADAEKTIKQLESRSTEIDKLRSLLAETEQSVRHKLEEKEIENDKLRNILKNYESSYGLSIAKKEEEIIELQHQVERLKNILNMRTEEKLSGKYVQTTFDAESEAQSRSGS